MSSERIASHGWIAPRAHPPIPPSLDLRTSKGNKLAMSRAPDVWQGGRRHISIKAAKDAPRIHGLNLNRPTDPRPLERQQKSHPSPFLSTAPSKFVVSSLTAPPSHSLPHPSSIHSTPLFSSPLPPSHSTLHLPSPPLPLPGCWLLWALQRRVGFVINTHSRCRLASLVFIGGGICNWRIALQWQNLLCSIHLHI